MVDTLVLGTSAKAWEFESLHAQLLKINLFIKLKTIKMAPVVKRLRPRIVVPICMGSNPIRRPIKKTVTFVTVFFIRVRVDENPLCCGFGGFPYVLSLRKQELQSNPFPRSEIRVARKLSRLEPKVLLRNFPSVKQIQEESSNAHHKKPNDICYSVFYFVVLMTWASNCDCNLIKFMTNEKIICHAEQAEQRMKA